VIRAYDKRIYDITILVKCTDKMGTYSKDIELGMNIDELLNI